MKDCDATLHIQTHTSMLSALVVVKETRKIAKSLFMISLLDIFAVVGILFIKFEFDYPQDSLIIVLD